MFVSEYFVTSRHTVWGYVDDANGSAGEWKDDESLKSGLGYIPGGTRTLTGNGLMCSSCHNPHGTTNPRLLKTSILGIDGLTVGFTMGDVGNNAKIVTAYVYGSSKWCGSCHDKFKTLNNDGTIGEGHANYYLGMWRHPLGGHILPPPGFNSSLATGTPPEQGRYGIRLVACLTCHRAHSTTAIATGYALNWPRDPVAPGSGTTSALLRMNNRGICYNCHGAGQYNSWKYILFDNSGRYTISCSYCHLARYDRTCLHCHGNASCYNCHPQEYTQIPAPGDPNWDWGKWHN